MPNVTDLQVLKFQEDSGHEMVPEATWSGFEVEVENDSNESIETKSTAEEVDDCSAVKPPSIVVECLPNNVHEVKTVAGTSSGGVVSNNIAAPGGSNNISRTNGAAAVVKPDQPMSRQVKIQNFSELRKLPCHGSFFKMAAASQQQQQQETRDEFAAFAVYVQQELRKITDPYALQMTKLKINQVLFDGTTGAYDKSLGSSEAKPTKL